MSVDPWGGGSDRGPQLRPQELRREQRPRRKWYDRGERFYVALWLIFAVVVVATLIRRGGL